MLFAFFCGIFLIKYKIEFILCFPFYAFLFGWYLFLGLQADSIAERPERIFEEKLFMSFVIFVFFITVAIFWLDSGVLTSLKTPIAY